MRDRPGIIIKLPTPTALKNHGLRKSLGGSLWEVEGSFGRREFGGEATRGSGVVGLEVGILREEWRIDGRWRKSCERRRANMDAR
jgi:hypothetical protein